MKSLLTVPCLLLGLISPARADFSEAGQGVIAGTMTIQGNAFSVGTTTFTINDGKVCIGTTTATTPDGMLHIVGPNSSWIDDPWLPAPNVLSVQGGTTEWQGENIVLVTGNGHSGTSGGPGGNLVLYGGNGGSSNNEGVGGWGGDGGIMTGLGGSTTGTFAGQGGNIYLRARMGGTGAGSSTGYSGNIYLDACPSASRPNSGYIWLGSRVGIGEALPLESQLDVQVTSNSYCMGAFNATAYSLRVGTGTGWQTSYYHMVVTTGGKVGIGTETPDEKLDVAGNIAIHSAVPPDVAPTDAVVLYSTDTSAPSAELLVLDEAGNRTVLSPHDFSDFEPAADCIMPWSYKSENAFIGKSINVDMCKLAMLVEKLTGEKIVHIRDIAKSSWTKKESARKAARKAQIQAFIAKEKSKKARRDEEIKLWKTKPKHLMRELKPEPYIMQAPPPPYEPKPVPKWLKDRGAE